MRILAPLVILVIALAGCGSVPTETTFTVPEDAPASADTYTGNGYDLRVRVEDQNGTPLQGAAVVVFTMGGVFGGGASAEASAGEGGARAVAFWEAEFNNYQTIAGLRTNSEGWASVQLEPNVAVHVAAGDVHGMTTEVRTHVSVGSGGDSGSITVPLYPETVHYSLAVNFGNTAGSLGLRPGSDEAYAIPFSDDSVFSEAYRNRVYDLEATIMWTNGLEQGADLHVGIGDSDEVRWVGDDDQQYVNDGSHEETVTVSSADLDGQRSELAHTGYHAYVITDWVSLGFNGVDVQIEVTANLKGSNIRIQ